MPNENLFLSWDTVRIYQNQADYLYESGQACSEEEALQMAYEDEDLISSEWSFLIQELSEKIQEINPTGNWKAEGKNLGWQRMSGLKYFLASTGTKFLQELLPKTDCTFYIYLIENGFEITNYHHDAPTGETYIVTSHSLGE